MLYTATRQPNPQAHRAAQAAIDPHLAAARRHTVLIVAHRPGRPTWARRLQDRPQPVRQVF